MPIGAFRLNSISRAIAEAVVEGWDLSTAVSASTRSTNFSVAAQEINPNGLFFKPDGTKMYMTGSTGDDVNEYSLSTAWDITTASYVRVFSVAAQETLPTDLFFKDDGTKMYVMGQIGDDVNEYSLSTAWDISTASFVQLFSVGIESAPTGLFFKPDGTKMYMVGSTNDTVYQYSLSTAWNVSTTSYDSISFSVASQETTPQSIFFKDDGTKMYIVGSINDAVYQYSLSTAWDVSTASYDSIQYRLAIEEGVPTGLFFKDDGTKMYMLGSINDAVYQYSLSTAWDVSSAPGLSGTGYYFVGDEELNPTDVFFKPDGTIMYIIGVSGDEVNEYSLSTAWDVSTASFVRVRSISSQEINPNALVFKPDGTKMYVMGQSGDDVNEYSLSTAWNISTTSFVRVFSVAAQDIVPQGLFFKDDGTKMYMLGSNSDTVYQYSLSTAWNVSTASYDSISFSVASQETDPTGLFFKDDGTIMYIVGLSGDDVNEYSLSTAWDVSTASFVQLFSVAAQETSPQGVHFKPDGTKMYIVGFSAKTVFEYNLG